MLDGSMLTAIDESDPTVPTGRTSGLVPDFGLSLAYRFKGLSVGFATRHITEGGLKLETLSTTAVYNVARHYYAHASYDISLGHYLRLKPLVFLKSDAASTQFDNQIWFGVRNISKYFDGASIAVGYRIDDAVVFGAEVKLRWFSIGYSYDMTTSQLNNYSNGSHEFFLRAHVFKGYRTSKAQLNRLEE
jgi:type IX secretion system PorP/SprF family membrane protein